MSHTYDNLKIINQLQEQNRLLQEQSRLLQEQSKLFQEQSKSFQEENQRLREKISKLEEKLRLNSKNSSSPPSRDQKKNKQAPKGGAKPGHKGHFRPLFSDEQISKKVIVPVERCPKCGSHNMRLEESMIFQQIDLPPIQPEITQIERERKCCLDCQHHALAPFPEGYDYTAFGPRLTAFVGMCSSGYRLSKRSIQELLRTAFGVKCSLGSISSMEKRLSRGLDNPYQSLFQEIDNAKVGYIDETSFRQECKTHYVWTVTTANACFLRILPTRGLASLNEIRPRGHPGITVSDRYQVYSYDKHQHCLAHIRRDLKKFAERSGVDKELGERALFELKEILLACRLGCRKTMQSRVGYRKKRLLNLLI